MTKFKLGDVCFLKGGSGALTVIALLGDDDVEVMWFTEMNEGQRAVLPAVALDTEGEIAMRERNAHPLTQCQ